jgi:hypothetical protein
MNACGLPRPVRSPMHSCQELQELLALPVEVLIDAAIGFNDGLSATLALRRIARLPSSD